MVIQLNSDMFMASGGARDVYYHPQHPDRCIKIQRVNGNQNINEMSFYERNETSPILPNYYGMVDTNLGKGLVVELVKDIDGEVSKSLAYYLSKMKLSEQEAKKYIRRIANVALSKKYLIHDAGLQNILLKYSDNGSFQPIMIDGFGLKDNGLKYRLRNLSKALAMQKTRKQIELMLNSKWFVGNS